MNSVANTASPYSSTPHARPTVSVESITTASFGRRSSRDSESGSRRRQCRTREPGWRQRSSSRRCRRRRADLRLDDGVDRAACRGDAGGMRAAPRAPPQTAAPGARERYWRHRLEEIGTKLRAAVGVRRHPRAALRQPRPQAPRFTPRLALGGALSGVEGAGLGKVGGPLIAASATAEMARNRMGPRQQGTFHRHRRAFIRPSGITFG